MNYIEKQIYQNISELNNWHTMARYKVLSTAIPKILIKKDNIEYIYNDVTNEILKTLDKIYNTKLQEILNESRTKYFTRGIASNELQCSTS